MSPVDIENIILIDKYIEKRMTAAERRSFRKRLKVDWELKEDYELYTSEIQRYVDDTPLSEVSQESVEWADQSIEKLHRKREVAKKITTFGIGALVGALVVMLAAILTTYLKS